MTKIDFPKIRKNLLKIEKVVNELIEIAKNPNYLVDVLNEMINNKEIFDVDPTKVIEEPAEWKNLNAYKVSASIDKYGSLDYEVFIAGVAPDASHFQNLVIRYVMAKTGIIVFVITEW